MRTLTVILALITASLACAHTIVCPPGAPENVKLAAKEVRRYIYLRTGELLPIAPKDGTIVLQVDPALQPQQYHLKADSKSLVISGGSDVAVLYGAYAFAEKLGVRFYLHGDTIPDRKISLALPVLDETCKPLFETRGILPFHDFPEGPDWWSTDDYRACVEQLAKLRMNFLGLHSYDWEPLIWRGVAEDVADDGTARTVYPVGWFRSAEGNGCWGLHAVNTGTYTAGAAKLFTEENMGSEIEGDDGRHFERVARLLGITVKEAHALGIKVCVGMESPLNIPDPAAKRLQELGKTDPAREIYRGMFKWLMKNAPVDYYWSWTPEGWIWGGNSPGAATATANDFKAALGALDDLGHPFTFATSGWVLGPQQNRSAWDELLPPESPMANINLHVGHAAIDPAFAQIGNRPKWAIPWFEGDPDKAGYQPWVKRMRYDAVDARRLGCTGLIGIHWRTKSLAQNISALAQAGWDQGWAKGQPMCKPPARTGVVATSTEPVKEATPQAVYQTLRYDLEAYPVDVPNGSYTVVLKFNEPHYAAAGQRVFGVSVQGNTVADALDVFAKVGKNRAFDLTVPNVRVTGGMLNIGFLPKVEYPFLAAIEITGTADARNVISINGNIEQKPAGPYSRRINVGGPAVANYEACIAQSATALDGLERAMPAADFYLDFCKANFGSAVARRAAAILTASDGFTTVFTKEREYAGSSSWGIRLVNEPWEKMKEHYRFVEQFAALHPQVSGAGNLERFDYWLNTLKASETMMRLACERGALEAAIKALAAEKESAARKALAEAALAQRLQLTRLHEELMRFQIAIVSTPGELGTIAALEQHGSVWRKWLPQHDAALTAALGHPLPPEAQPTQAYTGKPLLTVLTHRGKAHQGEALKLKIIALDKQPVKSVVVRSRPLGGGEWKTLPATPLARAVWSATLPAATEDFEYQVTAATASGDQLTWPSTAPKLNQTVVVTEP
jgi:hypothetical protein